MRKLHHTKPVWCSFSFFVLRFLLTLPVEKQPHSRAFDKTVSMNQTHSALLTRRQLIRRGLIAGIGSYTALSLTHAQAQSIPSPVTTSSTNSPTIANISAGDVAINQNTALLFCEQAPLVPEAGRRDAKAVWTFVPARVEKSVLIYLHGNNNYVTVDAKGQSRVPDWATTEEARSGAASKPAAPLSYQLDKLNVRRRPLVLVPEAATLSTKSFWAREPAGQYANPLQLGLLLDDSKRHLAVLKRPDNKAYLPHKLAQASPQRVYLSGHSGAGLPLEEAAVSTVILPHEGNGADLWLLDSTYWSKVTGFIGFCQQWHAVKRLGGKGRDTARFVCIYRGGTQTEAIADSLRSEIAALLGVTPISLLHEHTSDNLETKIRPALQGRGVVFIRTQVAHDTIPTFFIPLLLDTAAS